MTRISVCMATYNGDAYIRAQMDSILSQLSQDDEIVVSDDSSSDQTVQLIRDYQDPRIRLLPLQNFRNVVLNFENALRHAKGDYIFLSDQDDVWLPGKVEKTIRELQSHHLIVSDCKIVDEKLRVTRDSYFNLVDANRGFFRNLIRTSPYIGCCMAFKKEVLELALPFPRNIPVHDYWIAMLCELKFEIMFLREPLVLYRRHGGNLSQTTGRSTNSLTKKISFRVNTLFPLLKRALR